MYIDSHDNIYLIFIVILLLCIPVLIQFVKNNPIKEFSFQTLIRSINRALILQIIIGIVILVIAIIVDRIYYSNGDGNYFTRIFIESTDYYIIIGIFVYLPAVGILNLMKLFIKN